MREIEQEYKQIIENGRHENYESGQQVMEYINQSTAKYHGRCVRTLYMPKIFHAKDIQNFETLLHTLYGIFDKIMKEYVENAAYRALFGFEKKLKDLILRERQYSSLLPIARIDIFYNEETGDFHFCEFNTDGTSAMNEDRELNLAFGKSTAYQKMSEKYTVKTFELFDSFTEEFLDIYKGSTHAVEHPHIAIVDFMENATEEEFQIFKKSFEAHGVSAEICEIRELKYDGTALYGADGKQVNAIYRRAVTCDIMEHYEEVIDFIHAVEDEKVCLMGDFRTQIVHNKILYEIIFKEETKKLLTPEEINFVEAHFPETRKFCKGEADLDKILSNKDRYIIKPEDSYGSKGVFAGIEYTEEEWKRIVPEHFNRHYIVQEFCMPYQSINLDLMKNEQAPFQNYSNITGLYVYNGKFKGVYSRISESGIISTQYSEMAIPTVSIL